MLALDPPSINSSEKGNIPIEKRGHFNSLNVNDLLKVTEQVRKFEFWSLIFHLTPVLCSYILGAVMTEKDLDEEVSSQHTQPCLDCGHFLM